MISRMPGETKLHTDTMTGISSSAGMNDDEDFLDLSGIETWPEGTSPSSSLSSFEEVISRAFLPSSTDEEEPASSTQSLRRLRGASVRRNHRSEDEGNAVVVVGQKRRKRETLPDIAKRIPLDGLRPYLNVSLVNAAKELGISATTLKRLCRLYGIKRWPYRQIAGVDRTVERLKTELQSSKDSLPRAMRESMATHINELRLHREGMVELALEGGHDPFRGKMVCTGALETDIQVGSSTADHSVAADKVAGGHRAPSSPGGGRLSSTCDMIKARCPATPDQMTSDSCRNDHEVYEIPAFGRDALQPAAVELGMLPGATAASGTVPQNPASLETVLVAGEAPATPVNGRVFKTVSVTPEVLPPARSCLPKAFAFGADLVGGRGRSVVGTPSVWWGHLASSSVGNDRSAIQSGNGSKLNYISQPRVASPGLSFASPARFHSGHRYKYNNQLEPRSVCQVPIKLPQRSFGYSSLPTRETRTTQNNTRDSVGPRSELDTNSVGAKKYQFRGAGKSTDFNSGNVHGLGELMLGCFDDYDPATDGW